VRFHYDADSLYYYSYDRLPEKDRLKRMNDGIWNFLQNAETQGLQSREGQEDMMLDIGDAITNQNNLLVEAGVGIGKSYAYIVPLMLFRKQFNRPVIISTSTITLQEQLKEDIYRVSQMLNYPARVIIAKGQSHFVCLKKIDDLPTSPLKKQIKGKIKYWGRGKAIERSVFASLELSDEDWETMAISGFGKKYCRDCQHRNNCYFSLMRERLKRPDNDFIVCNHDLLVAHLKKTEAGGAPILADAPIIVVDEAHNLEDTARGQLTLQCSLSDFDWAISTVRSAVQNFEHDLERKAQQARSKMTALFQELYAQMQTQQQTDPTLVENNRYTYCETDTTRECIRDIHKILKNLSSSIDIRLKDKANQAQENAATRIKGITDLFSNARLPKEHVIWLENISGGYRKVALSLCPINIGDWLNYNLYSSQNITILTSATLTSCSGELEDMYRYMSNAVGFPSDTGELSEPKSSPFDYDHHALMYCADDLPHPSRDKELFLAKACDRLVELINISHGNALVLFTAKTDLQYVYNELIQRSLPYKIMRPKAGASQADTLDAFRAESNSVLLGTGAFWEGINLVGEALTNVIIFKLPFPVPDPIITAKTDAVEDGLMDVLVPEMIVKLKQGIGRLIRTETDKGIISIVDPRLSDAYNMRYRDIVFDALPIKNRTSDLQELQAFYQQVVKENEK